MAQSALWRCAPQWLSYYSPLVGGLSGAEAIGFEPTYYWDSLDGSVIRWLNEHTKPDERVRFATGPLRNLRWLARWGVLTCDTDPDSTKPVRWYVLQRRESAWSDADRWLVENATPAHEKRLLATPLLDIYEFADFRRAERAGGDDAPLENPPSANP